MRCWHERNFWHEYKNGDIRRIARQIHRRSAGWTAPGLALDEAAIAAEMARRAPGQNALSTARKESDTVEIQSGFFNGFTTGTPLCARIVNSDQHSKDYSILADKMRPGHADYAGHVRYQAFNDYRGGWPFFRSS